MLWAAWRMAAYVMGKWDSRVISVDRPLDFRLLLIDGQGLHQARNNVFALVAHRENRPRASSFPRTSADCE